MLKAIVALTVIGLATPLYAQVSSWNGYQPPKSWWNNNNYEPPMSPWQ